MTLLCSPIMTQPHLLEGAAFGVRQDRDHVPLQRSVRALVAHVIESHFSPFDVICDRSRSCTRRRRRVLAQMRRWMEVQTPPACGVDDIACHLRCLRQILFFGWVSLNEQKWVFFGERRRHSNLPRPVCAIPAGLRGGVFLSFQTRQTAIRTTRNTQFQPPFLTAFALPEQAYSATRMRPCPIHAPDPANNPHNRGLACGLVHRPVYSAGGPSDGLLPVSRPPPG